MSIAVFGALEYNYLGIIWGGSVGPHEKSEPDYMADPAGTIGGSSAHGADPADGVAAEPVFLGQLDRCLGNRCRCLLCR